MVIAFKPEFAPAELPRDADKLRRLVGLSIPWRGKIYRVLEAWIKEGLLCVRIEAPAR